MLAAVNAVEVEDGVGLAQVGDSLVVLWSKPAIASRWQFQLTRMESMAASRPDGILVLVVMPAVEAPPGETVRADMQTALRRLGPKLRRLVAVPLGNSLWLSVIQTTVRGLIVASGQGQRHRVAGSVSEGLKLLREKASPETPPVDELMKGIEMISLALGTKESTPPGAGPNE